MEVMVLDLKSEWRALAAVAMVVLFLASGAVLTTSIPAGRTVEACTIRPQAEAGVSMSASPYVAAKIGLDPGAMARANASMRPCRD